MKGMST